jgi:hypothetical protein
MSNEILPWVKFLPEHERTRFWQELYLQLDATHCSLSAPTWVDYEMEAEELVFAWKTTAEVHANPEVLAALTAQQEGGDFEVSPLPREPRYKKGSIITEGIGPGSRRWEVFEVLNAHYRVRSLFSAYHEPDVSTWEFGLCEAHTRLEWQKQIQPEGVIGADGISHIPQEAKTDG